MRLSAGQRLGQYEILAPLGRGGMGEVYRARDVRLRRDVAIKVLHELWSLESLRRDRFEQEARFLASLDHPNIAVVHGLETSDGGGEELTYLVMELVEGDTLAARIQEGPLLVGQAAEIFGQIAAGLEAAHERGVLHRDLKPANIALASDGRVKILDFGLAISWRHSDLASAQSDSPTLAGGQESGHLMGGTVAYMSPEQVRGEKLDRRADVWSFGCCLFEALSGKKAFSAPTRPEVFAQVLSSEPDWEALPELPRPAERLLRRCLEKDVDRRLRDLGDARLDLNESIESPALKSRTRRAPPLLAGVALVVVALGAFWAVNSVRRSQANDVSLEAESEIRPVRRLSMTLPQDQPLESSALADTPLAISADGTLIAYSSLIDIGPPEITQVIVRQLAQTKGRVVSAAPTMQRPFFSPDGSWFAFFGTVEDDPSPMYLFKAPTTGGPAIRLAAVDFSFPSSWGSDDNLYFVPRYNVGIHRVSSSGGTVVQVTELDEARQDAGHAFPYLLPGNKALLYTAFTEPHIRASRLCLVDLVTGESRVLMDQAGAGRYLKTGHLVFAQPGRLTALPFDLATTSVVGPQFTVTEEQMALQGEAPLAWALSEDGTLVYVSDDVVQQGRSLVMLDSKGTRSVLAANGAVSVSQSRDGRLAAVEQHDERGNTDIWLWDLEREVSTRLTTHPGEDRSPLLSPDGKTLYYQRVHGGGWSLYQLQVESPELTTPIYSPPQGQNIFAAAVVGTGDELIVYFKSPFTEKDLWLLDVNSGTIRELLKTRFGECCATVSPDGRWLAYTSDEDGAGEVYLRSYPDMGKRIKISASGGMNPRWSPSGEDLYFWNEGEIVAARFDSERGAVLGGPIRLLEVPLGYRYSSGGSPARFLVIEGDPESRDRTSRRVVVVQNWFGELTRRDPRMPSPTDPN